MSERKIGKHPNLAAPYGKEKIRRKLESLEDALRAGRNALHEGPMREIYALVTELTKIVREDLVQ